METKTEHLYGEQNPDARLQDQPTSRFRPTYRPLSAREKALHDAIKDKAVELERLIGEVLVGRETALAMTKLEESIMWAIKGLTK